MIGIGSLPGAVIAKTVATGEAFFTGTTWRCQRAARVSVSNWQTNEPDVARSIAAVKSVLAELPLQV